MSTIDSPVPAFTESGVDPIKLGRLPGPAMAAACAVRDVSDAMNIAWACAGMDDMQALQVLIQNPCVPLKVLTDWGRANGIPL